MSDFGDVDPEDAYDASDPLHVRLLVIAKIVESLDSDPDLPRRTRRRSGVVRLLHTVTDEVGAGG